MTCPFYRCDGRPECILGDARTLRKQAIKLIDICDSLGDDTPDEAYR